MLLLLGFHHSFTYSEATIAPTVNTKCNFKTSSSSYSGTSDSIYATFIGDFATSGPHNIGSFDRGSRVTLDVTLDKVVGVLQSIRLFTNGTDGWLLAESSCELDGRIYTLEGPRQWLDGLDITLIDEHGDGNEPFAQEDTQNLPSSPTLILSVIKSWRSLSAVDGVFKPPIASVE